VAAGLLWPVYIAFGFFWSWFCIKVFRAEADKIMRPVLNNEEIDSILGENEEGQ
jgi:hypothetical protein